MGLLLLLLLLAGFFLGRNLGYFGGSTSFNLPNVVNEQAQVATATLQGDGLNVKQVQQVSSRPLGTVISTNPPPQTLVKKGDTITIKVAAVAPTVQVTVPDGLTNTTQTNAEAILQSAGLQSTVVYKTSTAQKGTVLSTNPTSGTKINQGASVALTVSSGPANVTVPSLIGLSEGVAGQTLGNVGLNVGSIRSVDSAQYAAGLVVSSDPSTGAAVAPGSSVNIAVSTGPPPATTTTTAVPATTTTTTSVPATTTTTTTTVPKVP